MKLRCPKCNSKNDIGLESRFCVFECSDCGENFRGVNADEVLTFGAFFFGIGDREWQGQTPCPMCYEWINMNAWKCPYCRTELSHDDPEPEPEPEPDGTGKCCRCGTMFSMRLDEAVCPVCLYHMSVEEAIESCGDSP